MNSNDLLRQKYLDRNEFRDHTFHSVILAGVHDIKNIKQKMIVSGRYTIQQNEGVMLSPWNIATAFNVDMSFSSSEISSMLIDYEKDHKTNMNIDLISSEIYKYTSGYPFLVSRVCQCIDIELNKDWTIKGVQDAIKILLIEKNTLFDDLSKNIKNNQNLYNLLYDVLIIGKNRTYSEDNTAISLGSTYGIVKEINGRTIISNRIFEIRICNFFIVEDEEKDTRKAIIGVLKDDIVLNGKFNMELCLTKFAEHYREIFDSTKKDDDLFLERHGRMVFLCYIKPLINGNGFYHIESELTDLHRMDLIIDYGNEQFIIELKLWNGQKSHSDAYIQLTNYLETKNKNTGYLLTFDFRKPENRNQKCEWIKQNEISIFDVIV